MSNKVLDIKSRKEEKQNKLKEELMKGLDNFPGNITSALVAVTTDSGEVHTGFFNTSFSEEATMLKVLDLDMFKRQFTREGEEW